MKTIGILLCAMALSVSACAAEPTANDREPSAGSAETVRPEPTPSDAADQEASAEADIYAAVVRRLVMEDHTFGSGSSPFKRVYVVDGPIEKAGNPMNGDAFGPSEEPFSDETKQAMIDQLEELPPVHFVADADKVRQGTGGMGGVKNHGVIISLAPIERRGDKLRVGNALWCSGLCGQWLTYVLERTDDGWKITGTAGPLAIS